MGYNKKALSKIKADLNSAKAPSKPRDIIYDPRGQWEHPGQPTRIPGGNITMQDVPYPVMAYPNIGQPQMMYPNQDYQFPNADYVDEYPQMKKGGSKKYSRDITATNRLLMKNPLFKKRKSKKKKIFDPNSPYFQSGGYLPKAQKGINLSAARFEAVPFSYNYSNLAGRSFVGHAYGQSPTYRLGVTAPIKKPRLGGRHSLGLDVGLPYGTEFKPSTELRYDYHNNPKGNILPYVNMKSQVGYDPEEKGFAGMGANFYGSFGTARSETGRSGPKFGKNDWYGTLGPAFEGGLSDIQIVKDSEGKKHLVGETEWSYGLRGSLEWRPSNSKWRVGTRYGLMFDPKERQAKEIANTVRDNGRDDLQFSTNPSIEFFGSYPVDLSVDFKKKPSNKKSTSYSQILKDNLNPPKAKTKTIDGIPVEDTDVQVDYVEEPCPEGYIRHRAEGRCVPIEKAHHPRWLKEGGKLGPIPINSGRKVLRDWTYGESIGMLQEQDGGSTFTTQLSPEEEANFQDFYGTLPENLQQDDPSYDIRGYWDSEGRPGSFNYDQPKEDDGYYHAYSINQNTGEYLKSPWHETFQHAVDEDKRIGWRPITNVQGRNVATENPAIASPEEQSFLRNTEGPVNDYIETELTPEEIEVYRQGGYIVEDIDEYQEGGTKTHKSKDGTITNTIQNSDGTQTIQVKKKDGSYFEKTIPINYEKQLDKLKEEYRNEQDYEKALNYAGVVAYPAAIVSSAIDAASGNYGDAAIGLVPFLGKGARGSQLARRGAYTSLINSGVKHGTAKYVRPAIDYTTKTLGLGSAAYDVTKQEGGVIETELTPEEIEWYKSQGYEVEELD